MVTLCLCEQVEKEYLPLYEDPGLGLTTWSPLYSGLLTGKYLDAKDDSARLHSDAWKDMAVRAHLVKEQVLARVLGAGSAPPTACLLRGSVGEGS